VTPTSVQHSSSSNSEAATGLLYGLSAYLIWGFFPLYFKLFGAISSTQIVCHRIVWSFLFLILLSFGPGRWSAICNAMSNRRSLLLLISSALLIATNWLVFIIAVGHGQVLQSSLGYFITPFVSVLLGMIFFKERLRRLQIFALLLAATGVITLTIRYGSIPWTALILASTFGSYGLLRKIVKTEALPGLTVETIVLAPAAAAYLFYVGWMGEGAFLKEGFKIDLLLISAGAVTAVPLLLFAAAARRLKLATIGFLQYITPTIQFLLAVLLFDEFFSSIHLISFIFIWIGLLFYSLDAWLALAAQRSMVMVKPE